jgi:hypothetical protein
MDEMIGSMTGDAMLGRRLEAYAEARLSPDLATSTRLRARVLAAAHRRAALSRADAGLTVLSPAGRTVEPAQFSPRAQALARQAPRRRRRHWRRVAALFLAASLGGSLAVGGVAAARPGGPLYEARLWAETLQLPSDPSARAVAELDRLKERLRELGEASRAGDTAAAMAALEAYKAIVDQASDSAILAGDEVAAAVLQTGVGRNVEVLQALIDQVPEHARIAISEALEAAITRSADAIERIGASRPPAAPGDGDENAQPAVGTGPKATRTPTAKPTAAPAREATPKPKPTPVATPEATPKPTPSHDDDKGGPKAPAPDKPAQDRELQGQHGG